MEKDSCRFCIRLCYTDANVFPASRVGDGEMCVKWTACSSKYVEESFYDDIHSCRNHPSVLQDFGKELAYTDCAIRKDESYQLSGTVIHRSYHILQLGIPSVGCMRPHSQLRPRNLLHRSTVRILYMVDEASQERTFRAAVVHTHMVRQERLG